MFILAQNQTQAATLPYDWRQWQPTTEQLMWACAIFAGTLLAAILLFLLARAQLRRLRLAPAFSVAALAFALYFGVWRLKPDLMREPGDLVAFWITRLLIAALLFVTLSVFDRMVIIPLLTRRGRVTMPRFVHQIVSIVLALFVTVIYGSMAFGWDIDRFLAGSAVVSIVLGLALQESLGNFFSGLVLQASPPFAIGDWIICGEHKGRVTDMTWRAVTLHTDDDNFILIPNANIAKADIINFHFPSTSTARYIRVGLDYDHPPADAIAVLKAAALESPGVLSSPEPYIYLEQFGDSAVSYAVKFWIKDPSQHDEIESQVRVHAWYRLKERGFNIPFPVRTVEHTSHTQKARRMQAAARAHRISAIQGVPLLQPLSAEQKSTLADAASEVFLTAGQMLFRQHDSGDSFFIIYKGEVEVLVSPEGGGAADQRQVATLKAGDFFGEMSALTGQPRTASIRATAPLACIKIEKQDLLPIFQADPALMEKISAIVATRNAERDAIAQGAGIAFAPEAVVKHQKSLLGRMISFFRLGHAA